MLERFRNQLYAHREISKHPKSILLRVQDLYPGCEVKEFSPDTTFPLPASSHQKPDTALCRVSREGYHLKEELWLQLLDQLGDGQCFSMQLSTDHPAFDVIHLHRFGKRVRCYLEQLKHCRIPTEHPNGNSAAVLAKVRLTEQRKFWTVMKEMTLVAKRESKFDVEFVPVFCDGRSTETTDWKTYWTKRVNDQHVKDGNRVSIVACVCGTKASLPSLFPCIEHRFALLGLNDPVKKTTRTS